VSHILYFANQILLIANQLAILAQKCESSWKVYFHHCTARQVKWSYWKAYTLNERVSRLRMQDCMNDHWVLTCLALIVICRSWWPGSVTGLDYKNCAGTQPMRWHGGATGSTGRRFKSHSGQSCVTTLGKFNCSHICVSVTKQYNVTPADGRWRSAAGKVTAGLAESNGSLPPGGWPIVTCGWLPVHRDQDRAQRSVTSMGSLYLLTKPITIVTSIIYLAFSFLSVLWKCIQSRMHPHTKTTTFHANVV